MDMNYSSADFVHTPYPHGQLSARSHTDRKTKFEQVVFSAWDKAMNEGVFRYTLDDMKTKNVDGNEEFILQLNLKRGIERRKPEFISSLDQPYNPQKFNFTKVKTEEILCTLCPSGEENPNLKDSRHLVIVNVSPLEYGHILLVPNVDRQIPQKLDYAAIKLAIDMMLLTAHPGFRVGFNSLCALASVNHQHLHAWYMEQPLKIERADMKGISNGLYEMINMPTRALAFQLHGSTPAQLSRRVAQAAEYMQSNNIAHNLYITRGRVFEGSAQSSTVRVFLWPRQPVIGAKNEHIATTVFNVAVAELAGQVPMFAPELFDSLSEDYIKERLAEQMLPIEQFSKIVSDVADILKKDS